MISLRDLYIVELGLQNKREIYAAYRLTRNLAIGEGKTSREALLHAIWQLGDVELDESALDKVLAKFSECDYVAEEGKTMFVLAKRI
jgi:hypothetical protein